MDTADICVPYILSLQFTTRNSTVRGCMSDGVQPLTPLQSSLCIFPFFFTIEIQKPRGSMIDGMLLLGFLLCDRIKVKCLWLGLLLNHLRRKI